MKQYNSNENNKTVLMFKQLYKKKAKGKAT